VTDQPKSRISYVVLCGAPFVAFGVAAARPLRIPGVYQAFGVLLFAVISAAAWTLGTRAIRSDIQSQRLRALSGTLLVAPFAYVALFWVGLGGPWAATPAENQMRYLVLILMAISTAGGFVMLREALSEAGERFYSTLGFAAVILAGPLFVTWNTFVFGAYSIVEQTGEIAPAMVPFTAFRDLLLSMSCALTYFAAAMFVMSLSRVDWLGRKASLTYIILNVIALTLVLIKVGVHPDPTGLSQPWYTIPGFILQIPALPLIMPALLGAVVLRRAGSKEDKEQLPDNV
jgi:hypothetical protein